MSDECLAKLDEFEEVPGPFIRAPVEIEGWGEEVYAYFWNRAAACGNAEWGRVADSFASRERKRPEVSSGRLRSRLTQSPIAKIITPARRPSCSGRRAGWPGTSPPAAPRGRSCRGCAPCGPVPASRRACVKMIVCSPTLSPPRTA